MMKDNFRPSPFGQGRDWKLNACVGKNGGPYWYITYARGYFRAAEKLNENLFKDSGFEIDFFIYPLLYLYRHSLELYIKHILNVMERNKDVSGHNLHKLWRRSLKHTLNLLQND